MNIVKILKEAGATTKIKYYGLDDMATGFGVKNLIENKTVIFDYFDKKDFSIHSIDDYVDYLYLKSMSQYIEVVPIVIDDVKDEFESIIKKINMYFSKYQEKDLSIFIQQNYKIIFGEEFKDLYIKYDVIDYTIEYIVKYCSKNSDCIECIIKNFSYKIYDRFDLFKKIFNAKEDYSYYKLLLSEKILTNNIVYRLEKIKTVLDVLNKVNKQLYNRKLNVLIKIMKENNFNTNEENVMKTYNEVKKMKEMLKQLKHKEYYSFENELKKQEEILDLYLQKNGKSTKFEISIKPVVDMYESNSSDWYSKSLIITHSLDKKNKKKFVSNLEYTIKYCARSVMDHIGMTNIDSDELFTFSVINNISICMLQGKQAINYMVSDDSRLHDMLSYIYTGINNYFGENSLYYNRKNFEFDLDLLYNATRDFKDASKNNDDLKMKWTIYGIENLLCGIIEKILRNVYYELTKEEKMLSFSDVVLHSLVTEPGLIKIFGKYNCACLEYYLLSRQGIGKNHRNIFAHYDDAIYDNLTYDNILEEYYLLLLISNTLFLRKLK